MRVKLMGAALALAGGAFLTVPAAPASAADTIVSCKSPLSEVASGRNGTAPRATLHTLGSGSPTTRGRPVDTRAAGILRPGPRRDGPIKILSNLSDTSGNAWGCAASNCRIIDFVYGY